MNTRILLANEYIECTVIADPSIRCRLTHNETILIETRTESITIQLRRTVGRGGVKHAESIQEEGREDAIGATNKVKQFCEELASKILKKWENRSKTWKEGAAELRRNPVTFLGGFTSRIQWSYQTLNSSEKRLDHFLHPFHKINLFSWWSNNFSRRSKKSKNAVCPIRNAMYEIVKPGYTTLSNNEKGAIQKQVKRYVTQGEVLWLIYTHAPGLMITIPQFMTTEE